MEKSPNEQIAASVSQTSGKTAEELVHAKTGCYSDNVTEGRATRFASVKQSKSTVNPFK